MKYHSSSFALLVRHSLSTVLLASAIASTAACTGANPGTDVPEVPSDALIFPEVSFDVPGTRMYYQRCRENVDCTNIAPNGVRELCDKSFPGGMCHVLTCTDNSACGPQGICTRQRGCLPKCDLNSDFCNSYSGLCLSFDLPLDVNAACFPTCDPSVPGEPLDTRTPINEGPRICRAGLTCDPYQSRCIEMPRTTGAENGAPCRTDSQCRSNRCIPEIDTHQGPQPTGFLGGYCVVEAPLPNEAAFQMARGNNLPTSTCPPGNVVLPPADAMQAPGSAARCYKACTMDAECRAGYRCDRGRDAMGAPLYRNGGCVPIDCAAPMAQCPANTRCVMADADGGVLFSGSRCVSNPIPDGGFGDAAVDAMDVPSVRDSGTDAGASDAADAIEMDSPDAG